MYPDERTLHSLLIETDLTIHVDPGPVYIDPWQIEIEMSRGETKKAQFTIYNNKDSELSWSALPDPYSSWISLPVTEGVVPPNGSVPVEAILNPPGYDETGIPKDIEVGGIGVKTSDELYDEFRVEFEIRFR